MLQDTAAAEVLGPAEAPTLARHQAAAATQPALRLQQEWGETLLPALVAVLAQRRGQQLQESKEVAAGVLAKFAANGLEYAAAVG